jgi:hypothetical protein
LTEKESAIEPQPRSTLTVENLFRFGANVSALIEKYPDSNTATGNIRPYRRAKRHEKICSVLRQLTVTLDN